MDLLIENSMSLNHSLGMADACRLCEFGSLRADLEPPQRVPE